MAKAFCQCGSFLESLPRTCLIVLEIGDGGSPGQHPQMHRQRALEGLPSVRGLFCRLPF